MKKLMARVAVTTAFTIAIGITTVKNTFHAKNILEGYAMAEPTISKQRDPEAVKCIQALLDCINAAKSGNEEDKKTAKTQFVNIVKAHNKDLEKDTRFKDTFVDLRQELNKIEYLFQQFKNASPNNKRKPGEIFSDFYGRFVDYVYESYKSQKEITSETELFNLTLQGGPIEELMIKSRITHHPIGEKFTERNRNSEDQITKIKFVQKLYNHLNDKLQKFSNYDDRIKETYTTLFNGKTLKKIPEDGQLTENGVRLTEAIALMQDFIDKTLIKEQKQKINSFISQNGKKLFKSADNYNTKLTDQQKGGTSELKIDGTFSLQTLLGLVVAMAIPERRNSILESLGKGVVDKYFELMWESGKGATPKKTGSEGTIPAEKPVDQKTQKELEIDRIRRQVYGN